jgi:dienelactone hydrolase
MHFTSSASSDGVLEQSFTLGDVPCILWTPDSAGGPRPLILLGHGGGQHKKAPGIVARARRFVGAGFAAVALDAPHHGDRPPAEEFTRRTAENRARMLAGDDVAPQLAALHTSLAEQTVPEWQSVVTAVQELEHVGAGPVGYWGVSMGCGLGVPFVAADSRVRAAVIGLAGIPGLAEDAARITVPVEFVLQWDDQFVPRDQGLALFDAFGSAQKTLHANTGGHADLPRFEIDSALLFFQRHLTQ